MEELNEEHPEEQGAESQLPLPRSRGDVFRAFSPRETQDFLIKKAFEAYLKERTVKQYSCISVVALVMTIVLKVVFPVDILLEFTPILLALVVMGVDVVKLLSEMAKIGK